MTFSNPDQHRLQAAEGWLDLGDWQSANDELENIDPELRAHPDVLKIRFHICSAAKNWELALVVAEALVKYLPDDVEPWIHRSFALHEMKRTGEAQEQLLPAQEKFPAEWIVRYNLACYACQLGQREEARQLLQRAVELGDPTKVKLMALDDPDLAPLWTEEQRI